MCLRLMNVERTSVTRIKVDSVNQYQTSIEMYQIKFSEPQVVRP